MSLDIRLKEDVIGAPIHTANKPCDQQRGEAISLWCEVS
jgi:hypothetical protein